MSINTLIYSHGLKEEVDFYRELEKQGMNLRYIVVNENSGPVREIQQSFAGRATLHPIYDLRRGVFPENVKQWKDKSEFAIGEDLLKDLEPHLYDILLMGSRMDADGFSFSFGQRWELLKDLVLYWNAVLDQLQIKRVIINHVPHFPSEQLLYLLCQRRNIPVMMRVEISGSKNIYYSTSVMGKHLPMLRTMEGISDRDLSQSNIEYFSRLQKGYDQGAPWEIKLQKTFRKNQESRLKSLVMLLKKLPGLLPKLFRNTRLTMKTTRRPLVDKQNGFNYLQLLLYFAKARKIVRRNEKIYQSMIEEPNFKEKYVLFSSSYQPERTTCPDAGYFADLLLIIDMLAKTLPADWKIYYKEHPTSFLSPNNHYFFRGHMFRSREFFEKINSYPQVKMVDVHFDNYQLIDQSQGVATATGTTAWEAAIRGKVGLIFGNSWFEGCDGVVRVHTQDDLRQAFEKMQRGDQADLTQLKRFREAFLKLSEGCPIENAEQLTSGQFAVEYARFIHKCSMDLQKLGLM